MIIVPPNKRVKLGSVSGGADATFLDRWLLDGRPAYPYKQTGGISAVVTPDVARNVNVLGVARHLVPAGATVDFGGLGTVTIPTWATNDISYNAATLLPTLVSSGGSFSVSSSGTLIGDLWVGEGFELPDFLMGVARTPGALKEWPSEGQGPYIQGIATRRAYEGSTILTEAQFRTLDDCYVATFDGSLPSLFILKDPDVPTWRTDEVILGVFHYVNRHQEGKRFTDVSIFEIPNTTWGGV